jgi:hypothetical protein
MAVPEASQRLRATTLARPKSLTGAIARERTLRRLKWATRVMARKG